MVAPIIDGDNLLNAVNGAFAEVQGELDALDGANLIAGSVANSKLAKGKALFAVSLCRSTALSTANKSFAFGSYKLPNVDGASSSTWRYLGSSVSFGEVGTILGAGAALVVNKNGSPIQSVPVDSAVVTAAGVAYQVNLVTAASASSGDTISVSYTAPATGSVTEITMVHFWTLEHTAA